MNRNAQRGFIAWLVASGLALPALPCLTGLGGCSGREDGPTAKDAAPTPSAGDLVIRRVSADLAKPDPAAPYWKDVPEAVVTLTAQPMITPRPVATTTDSVHVKAVTDGKLAAFRIRWSDTEVSQAGRLGEFSDALALEFPIRTDELPPVMMGAKDNPVHIFHWRAQYQRDHEEGKPTMQQLYPNASIDMYPMEFKDQPGAHEPDREQFSPGLAAGNPQSYEKTGVDEVIAEGYMTSAVMHGSEGDAAHADWKDGEWTLVIVRPLAVEGGSVLAAGKPNFIGMAAWQGGQLEVASRKSVTMAWVPVSVQ